MNGATNAIIIGLIRQALLVVFALLAAHGVMEKPDTATLEQIAGGVGSLVVIAFSIRSKIKMHAKLTDAQNGTTATPAPKTPNAGPLVGLLCVGAMAALSCTGCVTALKSDKITSMSASGIGLKATSPDGTGILAGIFRFNTTFIPTSTNAIYAPRYMGGFDTRQAWNPFMQNMTDSIVSGEMEARTNATGGAIVPKSPVPAIPNTPMPAGPFIPAVPVR